MKNWVSFPYDHRHYDYSESELKQRWIRLHLGDKEPLPREKKLISAWQAFHAGQFAQAVKLGLSDAEPGTYAVVNKSQAIYATYLEKDATERLKLFEQVTQRALEHQAAQPLAPNAWYWHAYALGRYAQRLPIAKALKLGIAEKIKHSLEQCLKIEPKHADAHLAMGIYHAEIFHKVGAMVGALTYRVSQEAGMWHFQKALKLNPDSAIARIEYANALVMFEGRKRLKQAQNLYAEAAQCLPLDATEHLDVELARSDLSD